MNTSFSKIRAFTLIELMIVIAIIALLTGIILVNLTSAKGKARDAKRIADIGNIQLALSLYFDRCKQYPPAPLVTGAGSACPAPNSSINFGTYTSTIPTSPTGTAYDYAVSSTKNDFVLHTTLETYNDVIKDSLPAYPGDGSWTGSAGITCGNGAGTLQYCLGSK